MTADPRASSSSTTTSCSAAACGRSSATASRWSARRRRSTQAVDADPRARSPTSCWSTSTCPTAAGVEVIRGVLAERPDVRFLALSVSDAAEDVIAVIRAGARGYVTKTISGAELVDADPARRRRRRGVLAAAGRLRARRVRRHAAARRSTPSSTSSRRASARCCATSPAATPTRRSPAARHLGQDRRDPRVVGPAQAPALEPPRAHPLGDRASLNRLGFEKLEGHRTTGQSGRTS